MDGAPAANENWWNHYRLQFNPNTTQYRTIFGSKLDVRESKSSQIDSIIFLMLSQTTYYIFISDSNFNLICEPTDFSDSARAMYAAYITYSFLILKLTDYLDTIFFILRKKWNQVSFLHVYHHILVSSVTYTCVLFAAGLWFSIFQYNLEKKASTRIRMTKRVSGYNYENEQSL